MSKRKWTKKRVLNELKKALDRVRQDKQMFYKKDIFTGCDYTYNALNMAIGRYYKDDDDINHYLSKIDEIVESRVVTQALIKNIDAGFAKFYLINNYKDDFRAKKYVDVSSKGNSLSLSEAQIDKKVDKIIKSRKAKRKE